MKQLSVLLCTRNPRDAYLQRTLAALRAQTLPCEQWELLLVDNGSAVALADKYDLSWHPAARHLCEKQMGKLNAWMSSIPEAEGQILAFVDDDNVLAPDYLEQALVVGKQWPFIGAWGGSILPEYEIPLPPWVGAQEWRLSVCEVREDVWSNLREGFATVPAGAGLCVRSQVAEKYLERCHSNPTAVKLDRSGKDLGGYGDIDLALCALELGLGTGRSARLRLTHLIPASRLTLDYLVRHAEGDAASLLLFRALRNLPIQKPPPPTLLKSLRWAVNRFLHSVPREQYEIAKAYERGLEKGYRQAMEYLNSTANRAQP